MLILVPDDSDDIGCAANVHHQSYNHNMIIQNKLQELKGQYPEAIISYADHVHNIVMVDPRVGCGSGSGPYIFDSFATCGSPSVTKACMEPNSCG